MNLRIAAAILLLCACCRGAQEEAPRIVKFAKPRVPASLFTPDRTALLEPECERIATFLARYAARHCTAGVLRGEPEAVARGRLLLTVSLHLQPLNASAVHCTTRWLDGQQPALAPEEENTGVFSGFLLSAANRESARAGDSQPLLARVLRRLAADFDPKNEDAVLASEVQDRDGKAPPFRELLDGTLK
jgi:hypothetical protein